MNTVEYTRLYRISIDIYDEMIMNDNEKDVHEPESYIITTKVEYTHYYIELVLIFMINDNE